MTDTRYQFQPWYVKLGRWLRWRPAYSVLALIHLIWWALKGAPVPEDMRCIFPTRWSMAKSAWTCWSSRAQAKMGWLYTTEEVLTYLRSKHE